MKRCFSSEGSFKCLPKPGTPIRRYVMLAFLLCWRATVGFSESLEAVSAVFPGQTPPSGAGGDSVAPILSPDGRYIAFASTANNLVFNSRSNQYPVQFPQRMNVYLRDRTNATTTLVSVNTAGSGGGNGDSFPTGLSANGRYVLFESDAGDLVTGDTNRTRDVFVRDMSLGTTVLASVSTNGGAADGPSGSAVITPDGRYVAFVSMADNLVPNDTNRIADVFVRDMQSGSTTLASPGAKSPGFNSTAYGSESPLLSDDGRYVAFFSTAGGLFPGTAASAAIWVRDLVAGQTIWASAGAGGALQAAGGSTNAIAFNHVISADGQYIAYEASSSPQSAGNPGIILRYHLPTGFTEVVATDANVPAFALQDVRSLDMTPDGQLIAYAANAGSASGTNIAIRVWNAQLSSTILASGDTNGTVPDESACAGPALDSGGRYVAFLSTGLNLVTNSLQGAYHLYIRDIFSNITSLVDSDENGAGAGVSPVSVPRLSKDGQLVAFESCSPGSAGNGRFQVNIRDRNQPTQELVSARDASLPSFSPLGSSTVGRASSADGRFIAFSTLADNLVPNDTNECRDIVVRDRLTGTNLLVSVGLADAGADGSSYEPSLSGDGRYVAFTSTADNLVPGDTNKALDVFVRDLQSVTTTLASISLDGFGFGNGDSHSPCLSADGRYLTFLSKAGNLAPELSTSTNENLFWRDLQVGSTHALTTGGAWSFSMSADGRFVAFSGVRETPAGGLFLWDSKQNSLVYTNAGQRTIALGVSPDGNRIAALTGQLTLFVFERDTGASKQMNMTGGAPRLGLRFSGDSRFLAYATISSQLPSDTNHVKDVYLYDFQTASNLLVSRTYTGESGNGESDLPDISLDGRFVAYHSFADNLVPGDGNAAADVFLYDCETGTTTLLSASRFGGRSADAGSTAPVFSPDGKHLFFESMASDLVAGDYSSAIKVFALDLYPATVIETFLAKVSPGTGIIPCLVVTWPAQPGRSSRVQFKDSLDELVWQDLNGLTTVVGNLGSLQDYGPFSGTRFYRVVGF